MPRAYTADGGAVKRQNRQTVGKQLRAARWRDSVVGKREASRWGRGDGRPVARRSNHLASGGRAVRAGARCVPEGAAAVGRHRGACAWRGRRPALPARLGLGPRPRTRRAPLRLPAARAGGHGGPGHRAREVARRGPPRPLARQWDAAGQALAACVYVATGYGATSGPGKKRRKCPVQPRSETP